MLTRLLRFLFFAGIIRPAALLLLGVNVRFRERLPRKGPAILVANHNSHVDTAILMSLFSLGDMLKYVQPVAAADYWLKNRAIGYFALRIVGVIPIVRDRSQQDPLEPISQSLANGRIVIFYPEGTRGEPERMGKFKSGIARLAERNPDVPIIPIFLHGVGKVLPRGEGLLIPFSCDAFIGEPLRWSGKEKFLPELEERFRKQAEEAHFSAWE